MAVRVLSTSHAGRHKKARTFVQGRDLKVRDYDCQIIIQPAVAVGNAAVGHPDMDERGTDGCGTELWGDGRGDSPSAWEKRTNGKRWPASLERMEMRKPFRSLRAWMTESASCGGRRSDPKSLSKFLWSQKGANRRSLEFRALS